MVRIFQVWFQGNYRFCSQVVDLPAQEIDVPAILFCLQLLVNVRKQLLGRITVDVCKLRPSSLKLFGLLVQTVIGEMHE